MEISVVDDSCGIDRFNHVVESQTEISVDIEGDGLCRNGRISLIQIHMPRVKKTFIFDCKALDLTKLKSSLEPIFGSQNIIKYMFDCRADVDALYHQYDIKLCNVIDVQLYEIGFRKCSGIQYTAFYKGLFATLSTHSSLIGISHSDLQIKKTISNRFKNNDFALSLQDPMTIKYLYIDVAYLHKLYEKFRPQIGSGNVYRKIVTETTARENIWRKPTFVNDRSFAVSAI
jgi:ribonuclease D